MLSLRYKPTEGPGCSSDAPASAPASSSSCSSSSTASLSSVFTASSSMSTQSSQHLVTPSDVDSLKDSLRVLRRQADTTYKCNDYILRGRRMERWQRKSSSSTLSASHTSGTSIQDLQEDSSVDIACREKMALWSYRIIDHFDGDREIVAIAFNYLDRFLHLCSCDRSAFKLAAITSLFLATKLFSAKYVTMKSLAQLSKGEFDEENLKEMEDILLKTLGYRLHPPTIKCYIDHMMTLMPADRVSEQSRHIIRQRAHFFAELAVLDYSLSIDHPSTVAFAAIMNASEGFDQHCIDYQACAAFIVAVEAHAEIENTYVHVVRDRLWHLYSLSEEAQAGHSSSSDNSNTTSTPTAASSPTPFEQEQQSPRSSVDYFGRGSAYMYSPVSILFEGGCCH